MPIRRSAFLVIALAALLTGCGGGSSTSTTDSTSPAASESSSDSTRDVGPTESVSDQAGRDLCDRLRQELPAAHGQNVHLARIRVKSMAVEWAVSNGYNTIFTFQGHNALDAVTTKLCPDVRQDALTTLDVPSLEVGVYGE